MNKYILKIVDLVKSGRLLVPTGTVPVMVKRLEREFVKACEMLYPAWGDKVNPISSNYVGVVSRDHALTSARREAYNYLEKELIDLPAIVSGALLAQQFDEHWIDLATHEIDGDFLEILLEFFMCADLAVDSYSDRFMWGLWECYSEGLWPCGWEGDDENGGFVCFVNKV